MATVSTPAELHDGTDDIPDRPRMTLAEFNALPDDPNVDRMLIRGELWEEPMTRCNRRHARTEVLVGQALQNWADTQPEPRPEVYSGDVGCDLPELETSVGIAAAVFSAATIAAQAEEASYIVGAPILAVEILSPSNRQEEIFAKVRDYLAAGVKFVWVIDPNFQTVVVHRPDGKPEMYSGEDELIGDPHLPGLRMPAHSIFGR